mmetsp:Transcript_35025/g.89981  ORF Transcript_35025/g.89981 Transcript_35025/m.89981 type:complete len:358 (-) Transcript_35025:4023-5096(-)
MHDLVPCLTRGRAEERRERIGEVFEVPMLVERVTLLHCAEKLDAEDGEEDEQQQQHENHVDEARQRQDECHEDFVELLHESEEPEQPSNAEDADDRGDGPDVDGRRFTDDNATQGGHDADEVKDVPIVPEVKPAQRVQLEDRLHGEDNGEERVADLLEELEPCEGLREHAGTHEDRVRHDAAHDELLEGCILAVTADKVVDSPARRRQQLQVLHVVDLVSGVQRSARLLPLPLPHRQHYALIALLHVHELVGDDANRQVHEEHEAKEDPDDEEGNPEIHARVAQRLHVGPRRVTGRVHHVDPALGRRDLEERHHRVRHVVEVLAHRGYPDATLLVAQGCILDVGRAEVWALAGRLAL